MRTRSIRTILCILLLLFTGIETVKPQGLPDPPPHWAEDSMLTWIMAQQYGYDKKMVATLGSFIGAENDDDVAVCLHLGKNTGLDPRDIMGLKRKGMEWHQVIKTIGYDPAELFTAAEISRTSRVPGIFRSAFDKFRHWEKDPLKEIQLTDDETRNMVNLNLVVKAFGVPSLNVMRKKNEGADWIYMILSGGR
ncbi:MAG: hypothetical protein ACLFQV_05755 [Vulcanimicrobiota bacterium]